MNIWTRSRMESPLPADIGKPSAFTPVVRSKNNAGNKQTKTPLTSNSDDAAGGAGPVTEVHAQSKSKDLVLVEKAVLEQTRVREDCQKWLQILSSPSTVTLPTPVQWCKVLRGVCNWRLFTEAKALVASYSSRMEAADSFSSQEMFMGFVSLGAAVCSPKPARWPALSHLHCALAGHSADTAANLCWKTCVGHFPARDRFRY